MCVCVCGCVCEGENGVWVGVLCVCVCGDVCEGENEMAEYFPWRGRTKMFTFSQTHLCYHLLFHLISLSYKPSPSKSTHTHTRGKNSHYIHTYIQAWR